MRRRFTTTALVGAAVCTALGGCTSSGHAIASGSPAASSATPPTTAAPFPASMPPASSSPETSGLPECASTQYSLRPGSEGESEGVAITLFADYRDGPACRLTGRVTLEITDQTHRRLVVEPNPITRAVSGTLQPGKESPFPNLFYWSNWCGPVHTTAVLHLTLAPTRQAVSGRARLLPACLGNQAPSRLFDTP